MPLRSDRSRQGQVRRVPPNDRRGRLRRHARSLNVPADDRFQVINEHEPKNFVIDPSYLASNGRETVSSSTHPQCGARGSSRSGISTKRWQTGCTSAWASAERTCSSASSRSPRRTGSFGKRRGSVRDLKEDRGTPGGERSMSPPAACPQSRKASPGALGRHRFAEDQHTRSEHEMTSMTASEPCHCNLLRKAAPAVSAL